MAKRTVKTGGSAKTVRRPLEDGSGRGQGQEHGGRRNINKKRCPDGGQGFGKGGGRGKGKNR